MKKIKLTEASAKTPLEKMQDVDHGRRNENWGACSDSKLKLYYKTCIENSLRYAVRQCEQEVLKRNHYNWLRPSPINLIDYDTSFAQHIWDERNTCHRIIQEAVDSPYTISPQSRPSEYLVRAYILIKCMEHDSELKMMEIWIKNHMKDQDTYYSEIPDVLDWVSDNAHATQQIADAIKGVKFI